MQRRVEPWVETLEWLMDRSIRVGPWTIGLDPLLGLVPGAGDVISSALSVLIVHQAVRLRIPKSAVSRMALNVLIDSMVGAIPFVGDLFDFTFKANTKNLVILRESLSGERRAGRDWLFVAGVMLALLAAIALPLIGLWLVLRSLL